GAAGGALTNIAVGHDPLEGALVGAGVGVLGGALQGGNQGLSGAGQPAGQTIAANPAGGYSATAPTVLNNGSTVATVAGNPAPGFLQQTTQAVVQPWKDPQNVAQFTRQLAYLGIGQALAGKSGEEKAYYQAEAARLEELKRRDVHAYNARIKAAEGFLARAKQYDPTYVGQQAANQQSSRDANALDQLTKDAALSGRPLSGGDQVRAQLGASTNVGTAFDRGFTSGIDNQSRLSEAGLNALPTGGAGSDSIAQGFRNLAQSGRTSQDRVQQEAQSIAALGGNFEAPSSAAVEQKARELLRRENPGYETA
nr:hypothetical protein [Gammaproteobacteria bacterium]